MTEKTDFDLNASRRQFIGGAAGIAAMGLRGASVHS